MSNDLIVKANCVVEACYKLSLNEQRLILSAIAQIPKGVEVNDGDIYWVSVHDFVSMGVHPKTAYRELREAISKLYERSLLIKFDGQPISGSVRWIQGNYKTDRDKHMVGMRFSKEVLPYLSNQTSNFTQYLKDDIVTVGSSYSIRVYELICRFRKTGKREVAISDLRDMLQLHDKYPAVADIKRRVIDMAVSEINDKSPIKVKAEMIRTGRKYTHVLFTFKPKKGVGKLDKISNLNDYLSEVAGSEREPSWKLKGLSEGQIKKIGVHKRDFIDANNSPEILTAGGASSTAGYEEIWNSWKPLLADANQVSRFKRIQEILDRPVG